MASSDIKTDLRVLRAISEGARSLADLKKAMRKDMRGRVLALTKDGSVEKAENGELILTKRGAGRLRFSEV